MGTAGCYNRGAYRESKVRGEIAFVATAFVGEWLSLVEHLVRDQGVGGSNPLSPTNLFKYLNCTSGFPSTLMVSKLSTVPASLIFLRISIEVSKLIFLQECSLILPMEPQ
ncbi:MAG: hypothetical protein QOF94_139 [Acidobacteriaceae bacterium]